MAALALPALAPAGEDDFLLPDIIVRRSDLFDNAIRTDLPGRTHLILSNGTANVGLGKLHLYGVRPGNRDGTQDVRQRIFRSDRSFEDRPAGQFTFHPEHNHIHIDGWSAYRIRELLPDNGVGEVVAEGEKTSFCILDLQVHNRSLPNFNPIGEFRSCTSTIQGLSVGWVDVYDRDLPGQSIDITGLAEGRYWLESIVDPDDLVLESNEDNNVERIQVNIGDPNNFPDDFEPNNEIEDLDERAPAAENSPNLGPCNPKRVVNGLSLLRGDTDLFKFYLNSPGQGGSDFVRIDFLHARGDLDLTLLDEGGTEITSSESTDDREVILFDDLPEGWYYARVHGKDGATNLEYRLTVNPPRNEVPSLEITSPVDDIVRIHGNDSFHVTWSATDPEDNLMWVSVFLNDEPILDASIRAAATAEMVEADLGGAVVNSSEFEPGTYYFYCQLTDGGSTTGVWADGSVTFIDFDPECRTTGGADVDCDANEILDACEIAEGTTDDCDANGLPDSCQIAARPSLDRDENGRIDICEQLFNRGDANSDNELDLADAVFVLGFLFTGGVEPRCEEAADADNDGAIVITDSIYILGWLFLGGGEIPAPGPPGTDCGPDTDAEGFLGCGGYGGCI